MTHHRRNHGRSAGNKGVRARQKEATREAIAEAAYRLFRDKGLTATATAEIALAAGVSHGTLFLHFPRRGDLQREVIERVGTKIARAVHETTGRSAKEVLRGHLHAIAEDEDFYRRLLIEASLLGSDARSALIGVQSAVAHHLFAQPAGPFRESTGDSQEGRRALLFNTWIGLIHHYLINKDLFAPGASVIERWGEVLVAHFMSLVGGEGGER